MTVCGVGVFSKHIPMLPSSAPWTIILSPFLVYTEVLVERCWWWSLNVPFLACACIPLVSTATLQLSILLSAYVDY